MKLILIYFFILTLFTGCTFIPANKLDNPNSKNIAVTNVPPDDSCRYIGEINGSQGNWFTGLFTSNVYLIMGARNDLRNQAAKYKANYIHIASMPYVGPAFMTGDSFTAITAEAYHCDIPNEKSTIVQKECGYFSLCLHDNEGTPEIAATVKKEAIKQ